ncbi:MAG TPA: efflux RND transporter permease subunit, partial [Thermoanaerobaculia bacterium]
MRRPVFATVIILSLVVVGAFSYFKLGVDRFPNVEFPFVIVTTVLPGAAPEEIETEITDKVEEAVNTLSGIDELTSMSSENVSVVMISFNLEKNRDVAAQEVRDKISTIMADLPQDADPPIVQTFDPGSLPVVTIAVSGPGSTRDVSEFVDKNIRRRIETVYGVGQVLVVGARPRQINVVVDNERLAAHGLTAAHVVGALQSQNIQIPGGKVEQGLRDLTLRTYGRVSTPEQFGDIPVATVAGTAVRIRDVARIEDSMSEVESAASVGGKSAVVMIIRKQSGMNSIEVVDRIKERVEELRPTIPAGYKLDVIRDQSEFVLAAVGAVKEHLILGSLFAALVVWLFLSSPRFWHVIAMLASTLVFYSLLWGHSIPLPKSIAVPLALVIGVGMFVYFAKKSRPTLIAAVAIPSSLIATFAAMSYMGFTLNVITLLALTLAVGIVIDDAVVVLENIFRHMEEKNMTPAQAAVEGTREVGLAVMATSMSLIVVFLPVAFMGGIVGRFMYSFGVTMAFAIAVSLLVSFTLTPMMAARYLRRDDLHAEEGQGTRDKGLYAKIEKTYMRMLEWSMAHRWVIVGMMVVVFFSTVPLFMIVDKNFLPYDDEGQFAVTVRAPEGSSVETTMSILESIATRVRKIDGVTNTV